MVELTKPELRSLKDLAGVLSCDFVDARTTSKDFVRATVAHNHQDAPLGGGFVLSTCLRYEVYHLEKKPTPYQESFFRVDGILCLRRLLSLLLGLQSEIIGEKEILLQTTNAIMGAYHDGQLSDKNLADLKNLFLVAGKIRDQYYLDNEENYSTVAADMFVDYLKSHPGSTIGIVGGGYMADKFFASLLKSSGTQIKKILWFNRSTTKIESAILEITHLLDFEIEVLNLSEGAIALKELDAVFCAISNSPNLYTKTMLSDDVFVVDVSYPQVFEDAKNMKLVNIANTNFSQLVKNPVSYASIALANRTIDNLIRKAKK